MTYVDFKAIRMWPRFFFGCGLVSFLPFLSWRSNFRVPKRQPRQIDEVVDTGTSQTLESR